MKKTGAADRIGYLLVFSVVVISAAGCDGHARHRVLGFFFTGIDSVEEKVETMAGPKRPAKAPARKIPAPPAAPVSFKHGPYAAGLCRQCHDTSPAPAGRPAALEKAPANETVDRNPGSLRLLTAAPERLCTGCHDTMAGSRVRSNGSWVHGPVAQGKCTACHNPHQSSNRFMLVESPDALCMQCHRQKDASDRGAHLETGACLGCHTPHFGDTRDLLKAEFGEKVYFAGAMTGAMKGSPGSSGSNGNRKVAEPPESRKPPGVPSD